MADICLPLRGCSRQARAALRVLRCAYSWSQDLVEKSSSHIPGIASEVGITRRDQSQPVSLEHRPRCPRPISAPATAVLSRRGAYQLSTSLRNIAFRIAAGTLKIRRQGPGDDHARGTPPSRYAQRQHPNSPRKEACRVRSGKSYADYQSRVISSIPPGVWDSDSRSHKSITRNQYHSAFW
jgi:hypothetical protein